MKYSLEKSGKLISKIFINLASLFEDGKSSMLKFVLSLLFTFSKCVNKYMLIFTNDPRQNIVE